MSHMTRLARRLGMARILVIEDESDLRLLLDHNLRAAGHDVFQAEGGQEGLQLAREHRPELVLLDLMLPDLPGTEVCRLLRAEDATRNIAIIIVTAKTEEIDRVVGFALGADDYVAKPFSMRELLLRVRAVLRRHEHLSPVGATLQYGCLRVERDAHRVWVREEEIELTAIEFRLLVALYESGNRVLSRAALLDHVWGLDTTISIRTVDAHVKRLRDKLGAARDYIETVRGVGYRFAGASAGVLHTP